MKTVIVISGTPATGKEKLAKFLEKKLGLARLDLHYYYQGISTKYNRKKKCYDIDLEKFEDLVKQKKKASVKGLIIDSHIAHLLSKKMVDLCVVLTCSNLKKLEKRLKRRKYSARKVKENLDAEIFQVCLVEAREKGHKVVMFDVGKRVSQKKILREITKSL